MMERSLQQPMQRYRQTKMSQHKYEPMVHRSDKATVRTMKDRSQRKETPQSTAFDSNRNSKECGNSQYLKTLGTAQIHAAIGNNVLQSATTVSDAGNPYISSERLHREHPLKFGLKKKSYNTHLSSQMEARSPRLDNIASGEDSNQVMISEADENSATVDFRPKQKGNFFGSTKMLRKSQGLTEARMEFSVNGQSVP